MDLASGRERDLRSLQKKFFIAFGQDLSIGNIHR
jgi:hypothetical protein